MDGERMTDLYEIICLKRSKFANSEFYEFTIDWWRDCHIVYWKPDRRGYTNIHSEAGMYSASDLSDICGEGLDWMIMRIPRGEEE